jgi:hypothetical protein
MLSLRDDGLELPRWRAGRRIEWAPASYGAVIGILTNPRFAGAFAFGRTRNARGPVPMEQWEVLITGHHRGYITWEEYLANRQKLHANCPAPAGQGGGAVREGRGLLQGLLRCGRCGRMMRTGYDRSGRSGSGPATNAPPRPPTWAARRPSARARAAGNWRRPSWPKSSPRWSRPRWRLPPGRWPTPRPPGPRG